MTHIPFSPDFESKGYKLIYRNGERPEDYKVWANRTISTLHQSGVILDHTPDGQVNGHENFDLFLTPPELYVGMYSDKGKEYWSETSDDLESLRKDLGLGLTYYRLVPVE